MAEMKGITCCADCVYYSMKKHKCTRCNNFETDPKRHFYDDCPLPNVVEQKKGKWKEIEDDYYSLYTIQCSCCNHEWYFKVGEDVKELDYNFCPNCGADMRGTEDE